MSLTHRIFLHDPTPDWPDRAREILGMLSPRPDIEESTPRTVVAVLPNGFHFSATLTEQRSAEGYAEELGFTPTISVSLRAPSEASRELDEMVLQLAMRCFQGLGVKRGGAYRNGDAKLLELDGTELRAYGLDDGLRAKLVDELGQHPRFRLVVEPATS